MFWPGALRVGGSTGAWVVKAVFIKRTSGCRQTPNRRQAGGRTGEAPTWFKETPRVGVVCPQMTTFSCLLFFWQVPQFLKFCAAHSDHVYICRVIFIQVTICCAPRKQDFLLLSMTLIWLASHFTLKTVLIWMINHSVTPVSAWPCRVQDKVKVHWAKCFLDSISRNLKMQNTHYYLKRKEIDLSFVLQILLNGLENTKWKLAT